MRNLVVMLVGLALIDGGTVGRGYAAEGAASAGRRAAAAQTARSQKITAVGTVEPGEMAEASAQVAGRIVSLGADPRAKGKPIDYGSAVEAGTVLAQIDSGLYAARVEQERAGCLRAQAELARARIALQYAETQLQRAVDQRKSKAVSEADLDLASFNCRTAKASVAVAEAGLAQSKAALKCAEIELGYTTIKSPIKGVVIDRRVSVGQMVGPAAGAPGLFLVAKIDSLQVWATVNEADISRIREGQHVRFTVDAHPGQVFEGTVKRIRPNAMVSQNVVAYTVVVAISGPTEKLFPYLTAHLEFE